MDAFLKHKDFDAFQKEYRALIDSLLEFAKNKQYEIDPPLHDDTLANLEKACDILKKHLFPKGAEIDHFGNQKADVYGLIKLQFHELAGLLNDGKYSLQIRLTTLIRLIPKLNVCAGGIGSELEDAILTLRRSIMGARGATLQQKKNMLNELILLHVQTTHSYYSIGEIHYCNYYWNDLAEEMGLKPREVEVDPFIDLYKDEITPENRAACRTRVLKSMRPGRIAKQLADDYLAKIKQAVPKTSAPGPYAPGPTRARI